MANIVRRYMAEKVKVHTPADIKDIALSPYYGWLVEILTEHIRPDSSAGETPEVPLYEKTRGAGSTSEVDYWTSKEPKEVIRCHLNYVVPDTKKWEQQAAYYLDKHSMVDAFVKNAGLGFAIPYLHNGQPHDYMPDFIVRLKAEPAIHLVLETKGYDPLAETKAGAAQRWVNAVNADGTYGRWAYAMVRQVSEVNGAVAKAGRAV
jgi:type III restriction enzyme